MLMPLSASVLNIVRATPGWLRMHADNRDFTDIFLRQHLTDTDIILNGVKHLSGRGSSDAATENVISVLPASLAAV